MPTIKTDWYCIVNPHAGSGKTMSEWAVAEKLLTTSSVPYKTTLTNYKFHATLLAYEAGCHGYRKILAVGGDGSVHEVLNGILRYCDEKGVPPEEFTLAVIPIGSGNDWIKSTGVPHNTEAVVNLLASSSFREQDIVRVETSSGTTYMANVGGTGFDSHVCQRVNRQKEQGKRSKTIYATALMHTFRIISPFHATLVADGQPVFEGDIYSIALGNGKYSGGGMRQVPDADLGDGLLDYTVVPKAPIAKMVREVPRLFNGTIKQSPLVLTGQCAVLEIRANREELVEVDGEIEGNLPLKVSVTGFKIHVLAA